MKNRPPKYKIPEIHTLEELLNRLGWSGADLMRHIDVTKNTVTSWRRGHIPVPKVVILYLELLAKYQAQFYDSETPRMAGESPDPPGGGQVL